MQGIRNLKTWALGTAWLAMGLVVAGCTTYRPLDGGSQVPWAQGMVTSRVATAAPGRDGAAPGVVRAMQEVPAVDLSGRVHRVERGEALAAIAQRYGVGLRQIAAANDIGPPYTIFAGQILRVPGEGAPSQDMVVTAAAQPAMATATHIVRRGETLSGIARRHAVPSRQIAQLNGLQPPYDIQVGQKLRVPSNGEVRVASRTDPQESSPAPAATSLAGDGFLWPVSGKVIGRFGGTEDGQRRDGIDITARKGAPVRAAQTGAVVYAGDAIRGYGRMILLRHDGGYLTTYAHNSALLVNVGDQVERGQVIARMGDRLHFELRKGRKPIDPETLLVPLPTEVASSQ